MSIHGCCFDEGMSGRCGLECRCFLGGECPIPDEMAEHYKDELLIEKFGRLKLAILDAQTKYEFNEWEEIKIIMENDYGYTT